MGPRVDKQQPVLLHVVNDYLTGNGKTISLKAIMKTCGDNGFAPLYVKSFQSWKGEEASMADVFNKARQTSPCVVVFEDLDSLINDSNRPFFLNQLDGLEGNDGLLIIGTTNHFDRLDPGLSARPSRFDRKFKFNDPDDEDRTLYVRYWQKKLENNKEISFPEDLVKEVVDSTKLFSFAYLKEAFVSSLVTLATHEEENKPSFSAVLTDQIKALRRQLDKSNSVKNLTTPFFDTAMPNFKPKRPARPNNERDIHALLDALSDSVGSSRFFTAKHDSQEPRVPNGDFRLLLDQLCEPVEKADITAERIIRAPRPPPAIMSSRDLGQGARPQSTSVTQRIPVPYDNDDLCTLGEQNIPEVVLNVDHAIRWDGVLESYNHPEICLRESRTSEVHE